VQGGTPTIREVHGYSKQAAAFGYTGVRGLNAQVAIVSTPIAAPVIAAARLRRGNVSSHAGAGRLLAQAIGCARAAGASGQILARADSAYFGHAFVAAAQRAGAWFSVTARMNPQIRAAIASIDDTAWTAITYPNAVWDDDEQRWISDAEVAETEVTVFTSRRKKEHVICRLVVRRVKRLNPHAGQGELFDAHRHHAFVTNSSLTTIEADARHRDHAIVEQVIAELKDGPLAHLPSGRYAANAAWLAHAVIAFRPRPRRRCRRLTTSCPRPVGDAAYSPDQHPREDRVVRTKADLAPAVAVAVGVGVAQPLRHRDRDNLTLRPDWVRPENQVERPGRPADHPCPNAITHRNSARIHPWNQRRWIRAESASAPWDRAASATPR